MDNKMLKQYLDFTENTESPTQYHRWAFVSIHAAALGRNVWVKHGPWKVYPNMYILLSGISAARKSSALSIAKQILEGAGYGHFVPTRTSREQFLEDFVTGFDQADIDPAAQLSEFILKKEKEPENILSKEAYICASEFLDFIGIKNHNFINTLTNLWDTAIHSGASPYSERYRNRKLVIRNPVANILGGITPTNFGMAMPLEVTEQGMLSRLMLVHSAPTGRKITFPRIPTKEEQKEFIAHIKQVRQMRGEFTMTVHAKDMLDDIYQNFEVLNDARLQSYCGRRLEHLFKLAICLASMRLSNVIDDDTVEEANTILTFTETSMSAGLGEFGDSRHSKVAQQIIDMLASANGPLSVTALWKAVGNQLEKVTQLQEIIQNLAKAEKITQSVYESESHVLLCRRPKDSALICNNPARWL